MAVHVITQPDRAKDPSEDVVFRQRMARAGVVDPTETFKTVPVEVDFGLKDEKGRRQRGKLTLRYAYDSPFIFAVFKDNPEFAILTRDEWQAAASDAIEKFFALHGLQAKMAPKPEDSNRYNVMAEANDAIEWDTKTVERLQTQREEQTKREAAMAVLQAPAPNYGPYKPIGG